MEESNATKKLFERVSKVLLPTSEQRTTEKIDQLGVEVRKEMSDYQTQLTETVAEHKFHLDTFES